MLYARVSVRLLLVLVLPVIVVLPISIPEAAALNGLTVEQAVNPPAPFTCTPTAEDGMVAVPPVDEVRAPVALVKYAQCALLVRPGFNARAVLTVEVVLPALEAVLGASVKFTVVPALTVTVQDSFRVAFNCTLPMLEFAGPAAAAGLVSRVTATAIASRLANR